MGYKTTLCDVSLDGGHYGIAAPAVDFKPGLPAYLRITDINDDGTLNPSDRKSVDDSSAGNYLLHEGDIVFARTGNSTGRNYYYDPRDGEYAYAGFLIKFSLDPRKINPRYMKYYAQSKQYWDWVSSFNTGSTRGNINAKTYASMPIDLLSRQIQDGIVAICDAIDDKIRINRQLNDYLADLCETIAGKYCNDRNSCLRDICYQVTDHVDYGNANQETYVSTESLMQNKGGRQLASSLPTAGKITRYKAGDTLISNIRPYFKKIWYAPFEGTCSGDVIVFRANDPSNAPYLHACLRQDSFFDYVMQGAKGTKMPRGDKKQMMEFKVASSCSTKDLILLDSAIKQRSDNDSETVKLQALRDTLLPKLMSGEIDVSKVDLTQLTNNHLSGCGSFCSVCCPSGLASEFHEWFREHFFFGYGHLCKADLG